MPDAGENRGRFAPLPRRTQQKMQRQKYIGCQMGTVLARAAPAPLLRCTQQKMQRQKHISKVIDQAWDHKKSSKRNLRDMGLADDPNKVIRIPNFKQTKLKQARKIINSESEDSDEEIEEVSMPAPKKEVAEELEKQARAPRQRKFMLPKSQVEFLTYLLDKYGHDYKAMEKDKKNYYQETWKQIRAKIKTFMGIPQQYAEYLESRGLLDKEFDEEDLKSQAKALIMED